MKITLAAVTAITGLLAVSTASAATSNYKATLNAAQEVPPTTSTATGTADLTFDDVSKVLAGTVTLTGIAATSGQHLHHGELCGANAGTIIALPDPVSGTITVNKTLSAGEEGNLVAGKMYVNIHTSANPNGEIRGQLFKDGIGTCPAPASDAGTDSGTTDSGASSSGNTSSSGGSSSGGSSSGGSSGASTTRPDSGTTTTPPADDDSCNASGGGSPTSAAIVALGVGLAITGIARGRRKNTKK